jgi:hypothetical protein
MKKLILCLLLLFITFSVMAHQGLAINTDSCLPNASVSLDPKHLNKRVLIPRVAFSEKGRYTPLWIYKDGNWQRASDHTSVIFDNRTANK